MDRSSRCRSTNAHFSVGVSRCIAVSCAALISRLSNTRLRIGIRRRYLHRLLLRIGLFAVPVLCLNARLAHPVQRAVHSDPVDPGPESGTPLVTLKSLIPAQKRLLHNLLRIGFVACDPKRHPENSRAVSANKRTVRFLVAGQNGPDN